MDQVGCDSEINGIQIEWLFIAINNLSSAGYLVLAGGCDSEK